MWAPTLSYPSKTTLEERLIWLTYHYTGITHFTQWDYICWEKWLHWQIEEKKITKCFENEDCSKKCAFEWFVFVWFQKTCCMEEVHHKPQHVRHSIHKLSVFPEGFHCDSEYGPGRSSGHRADLGRGFQDSYTAWVGLHTREKNTRAHSETRYFWRSKCDLLDTCAGNAFRAIPFSFLSTWHDVTATSWCELQRSPRSTFTCFDVLWWWSALWMGYASPLFSVNAFMDVKHSELPCCWNVLYTWTRLALLIAIATVKSI